MNRPAAPSLQAKLLRLTVAAVAVALLVTGSLVAHVAYLRQQLADTDQALTAHLAAHPRWDTTHALVRSVPTTGPKSTVSFHAGLRASGNGSTSVTRPTRMSSAKNPAAPMSGFRSRVSGA